MMKRIFMVLLWAAMCSASALAQKGMSGFGANVPVAIGQGTTSVGIGLKYFINVSDYVRLEASAEYLALHSGGDNEEYDYPMFKGFVNGHLFLMSPRPARPYVIAGLGYVNYDQRVAQTETIAAYNHSTGTTVDAYTYTYYPSYSDDGFNYNIGLGYDFRLSHAFSMQVEATGMSCFTCSNDSGSSNKDIRHTGKWTLLARVGFTYNF